MNFRKVKFITSAVNHSSWPEDKLPEVVLIGKSNVGKSSLINLLVAQKIAKVSSRPGHTTTLNFFEIDAKMRIVDAPGHGFASGSKQRLSSFTTMMSEYLSERKQLKGALILLDGRREINQDDLELYKLLKANKIPILLVITKSDKLNQSLKAKILKNINEEFGQLSKNEIVLTSTLEVKSILNLQNIINGLVKG
jgi:GTP-binding protein